MTQGTSESEDCLHCDCLEFEPYDGNGRKWLWGLFMFVYESLNCPKSSEHTGPHSFAFHNSLNSGNKERLYKNYKNGRTSFPS